MPISDNLKMAKFYAIFLKFKLLIISNKMSLNLWEETDHTNLAILPC
jgi:hypothetical protein